MRFITTLGSRAPLKPSVLILCSTIDDGAKLAARLPETFRTRHSVPARYERLFTVEFPDVVVLDCGGDTVEIAGGLRKQYPDLALIVVVEPASRIAALTAGVDHCLVAPIDVDELVARAVWLASSTKHHRAMTDKLDQLRAWHDWVRYLVHDLRNPITAAMGCVSLARIENTSPPVEHDLLRAQQALEELTAMLRDVLDSDRIKHGVLVPRLESVDLQALVTDVSKRLSLEHAIEVECDGDMSIAADPSLIGRVFGNLIVNADRHAIQDPIRVQLAGSSHGVSARVTNDGPAIPPEIELHLFEPWRQAEGRTYGTGIGLAFCRLVCEAHAGKIWLDASAEGRVTFAFGLPREKAAA